jgi:hypothetical protein
MRCLRLMPRSACSLASNLTMANMARIYLARMDQLVR